MGCGVSRPVVSEDDVKLVCPCAACETETFSYQEGWRTEQSFSRKNGEDSASSSDLDVRTSSLRRQLMTTCTAQAQKKHARQKDDH